MKRLFPDTLLTRSILMLVAALVLAQIIAVVSFKLIAENMFAAMQRAAQVEVSLEVLSQASKSKGLEDFAATAPRLSGVLFVRMDDAPPAGDDSALGRLVRQKWAAAGQDPGPVTQFQVGSPAMRHRHGPGPGPGGDNFGPRPPDAGERGLAGPPEQRPDFGPAQGEGGPGPARAQGFGQGFGKGRGFFPDVAEVSVRFGDEGWANVLVSGGLNSGPPIEPFIFVLSLSLLAVAIAATFAARWIYKPLNQLAEASAALGRGEKHSPLPVYGPRDLRKVMQAFNGMATRMETTLEAQKDVLVAIGHDLRTPLTALRIRAAMIEDEAERDKMERALDQMQSLTNAALLAGTQADRADAREVFELGALLQSLCDDLTDLGLPVACEDAAGQFLVLGWPDDLTRALRNIIENAVRYGGTARVRVSGDGETCRIEVDDDGPGIAEGDREVVFEPLVRLEKSRNSETGGHGLGLHISRNIVVAHGGQIRLENRSEGGLRALVSLPLCRV